MKRILTNNIGLKIVSVIAAIILWVVIVNVDDPVINKTFAGIQVEIINQEAVTDENKTYEVTDGSDVISVTVTAERSVIENMSKDYIKATADLKQMTFMNTVPIEIKSTRYSDRIKSLTSRTSNIQVDIENRKDKQIRVNVSVKGEVGDGYVVGDVSPNVNVISVSGPESVVDQISEASIIVNLEGMNETFTNSVPVKLYNSAGEIVDDNQIILSQDDIHTKVEILETKEVPIIADVSGQPALGYSATGTIICDPSSVLIAGVGSEFDSITAINIPAKDMSINDATDNVISEIDIKKYLPRNIRLADKDDTGRINVIAVIEAHDTAKVELAYSNIVVENLPEGYTATILHETPDIEVGISGLADNLNKISGWTPIGKIDADLLEPRPDEGQQVDEDAVIFEGINGGTLVLELPDGIIQTEQPVINVNISRTDIEE